MCTRYLPFDCLSAPLLTMNIRNLTIYCLLYLVNAKIVSKKIEQKNAAMEIVRVITTSKEEHDGNREYSKFNTKTIRNPRHTNEPVAKPNVTQIKPTEKPKVALVKKPIPKFTDTGSDEDYQAKMSVPNKAADSVEHEDEDFSVDDYDFDVNHDEFVGRGKPLEPRVKVKVGRPRKPSNRVAKVEQPRPIPTLSQSKVKIPQSEDKPSAKVARNAATGVMKEEEYDEEFSAITKSPEGQRKTITTRDMSSFSEETEDSREEEMNRPMRTPRSSAPFSFGTYVDKLGEKTSEFVTKMLSYLPLFPQGYSSPEKVNDDVIAGNAPMARADPWLGNVISD